MIYLFMLSAYVDFIVVLETSKQVIKEQIVFANRQIIHDEQENYLKNPRIQRMRADAS